MTTPILTDDEAALYDRQIRLWGVEAQQRLGQSTILFHGFTAAASEICKNLVLAGIKAVTINDAEVCTVENTGAHLLLDAHSIGKNKGEASLERVRLLNPHVQVQAIQVSLDELNLSGYDLCCFSGLSIPQYIKANKKCRAASTMCFIVDTFGYFGYTFQDLNAYSFVEKSGTKHDLSYVEFENALKGKLLRTSSAIHVFLQCLQEFESKNKLFPTVSDLPSLLEIKNEIVKKFNVNIPKINDFFPFFIQQLGCELSPVCAIVGGVAAQEILKIFSHNDFPFNNFFFFNGIDDSGNVECFKQE